MRRLKLLSLASPILVAAAIARWPSIGIWIPFLLVNAWHPSSTESCLDSIWSLQEKVASLFFTSTPPQDDGTNTSTRTVHPSNVAEFHPSDFMDDSNASFSWEALTAEVLRRDEPIVVRGLLQHFSSDALRWDLRAMTARSDSLSKRNVTLRSLNPNVSTLADGNTMSFEQLSLTEALDHVLSRDDNHLPCQIYDLQILMDEPELQQQLHIPDTYTKGMGVLVAAAGGWKTEMHAHLDLTTNIVLTGQKRWYLVHRRHSLRLRPYFTSPKLQGISAQVQPWPTTRHPHATGVLAKLPRWVVDTGPGDALLFPPWTFHALENLLADDDPEPTTTNNTGAGNTTEQSTKARTPVKEDTLNVALIFSNKGGFSATTHPLWMTIWVQNILRMLGWKKLRLAVSIHKSDMEPQRKKRELVRITSSPFTSAADHD
jgi:hypothetical protein